ncbi:hypothetical protein K502DRAFT_325680 [Neoconidiobolus thromboides FSU 785]|nr:hypothetical protein K502DRAFT_325680 [Neoconidiobolus thromboides FSU 785]
MENNKMMSNRQKRLQLLEASKRDASKYSNQSAFRLMERKYKQRVPEPDFNSLIQFNNVDDNKYSIKEVNLNKPLEHPYLNSNIDKAYIIKGLPGFIYIPNPFKDKAQREILLNTIDHIRPPFISNLDTHYIIPKDGIFTEYVNKYNNPDITLSDVKLKLDLNELKNNGEEKKESEYKGIKTTLATQGYQYNGLNDKNAPIKNTNLKQMTSDKLIYKLRWITFGVQYHWPTKKYLYNEEVKVPSFLGDLCKSIIDCIYDIEFFDEFHFKFDNKTYSPEAGVFNFYQYKDALMGHIDKSEPNTTSPLISFSFGNDAVFVMGHENKEKEPFPIRLSSGDIVIMAGPSRLFYHGNKTRK